MLLENLFVFLLQFANTGESKQTQAKKVGNFKTFLNHSFVWNWKLPLTNRVKGESNI